jgi:hypothetical protein
MGVKARVIVTHYDNPAEPVILGDTRAANLHFGELTPEHARRERRHRRKLHRGDRPHTALTRFF